MEMLCFLILTHERQPLSRISTHLLTQKLNINYWVTLQTGVAKNYPASDLHLKHLGSTVHFNFVNNIIILRT
jgi:hypothetical protein